MRFTHRRLAIGMTVALAAVALVPTAAWAASAREIEREARQSLQNLYASQPQARNLGNQSKAILIFPKIVKGGFMVGGQTGDGVLLVDGKVQGYYNISAASFGLQFGAQRFSYALFFLTDSSLNYLRRSDGWSIGSGPSVVVADEGLAKSLTSTTLTQDVYAFPFAQKGLMAGLGLEGSKITEFTPDR